MPRALAARVSVIERRIALAQGDGVAEAVQNRQQLAEAPDAGVVQRLRGAAPLAPQPLERARVGPVVALALAPAGILHFKQVAADGAAEVRLGFRARDPRPASKTAQLMQIVVHAWC